jgi:hypothetical protein
VPGTAEGIFTRGVSVRGKEEKEDDSEEPRRLTLVEFTDLHPANLQDGYRIGLGGTFRGEHPHGGEKGIVLDLVARDLDPNPLVGADDAERKRRLIRQQEGEGVVTSFVFGLHRFSRIRHGYLQVSQGVVEEQANIWSRTAAA